MADNTLFYGDNLDVLRRHIADGTVDLVYLDPPFKSDQDYNILFGRKEGAPAPAQIKAFEDTWRWDQAAAAAYAETVEAGGPVSRALQAFRTLLGEMICFVLPFGPSCRGPVPVSVLGAWSGGRASSRGEARCGPRH